MQQKIIKYIALALAIGLSVSIIGGIFGVIGLFGGFFGNDAVTEEMMFYGVKEDICSLNIEINAADITIKEGDTFSVESNLKNLRVTEKDKCLNIVQTENFRGSYKGAVLTVTVPSEAERYPVIIFIAVLLPAPLWPSSPTTSPLSISKLTSSSAQSVPYRLVRFFT